MAFGNIGAFSYPSTAASRPLFHYKPSSFPLLLSPSLPPLRFHLPPLKAQATLPSSSSIPSPSLIFLPHLEANSKGNEGGADSDDDDNEGGAEQEEPFHGGIVEEEEDNGEDAPDPIRNSFESLSSSALPSAPPPEDGVVGEILGVARSLPKDATLGHFLASYAGRLGEGECIELLGRMGEEGLARECLYLFEWMVLQEPSLVTPRACMLLFLVLGRAGMGDVLMVLLQNLPKAREFRDVCIYNSAISGLTCCGRYDDAWKVYEVLEANNIMPDHVTCSILITITRRSGKHAKDAWNFFERMNRKGVKWDLGVIGALIKCFCDEGLKKEALIIQAEMEKKGISSDVVIYNILMDAYSKSNQVEEVEGLFLEMKEKGIKPTVATYNILMDAYGRRMQPEIVESLMSEMQNLGLKPNAKSYACLTNAYGRQRKMSDMAVNSFLRMRKAGIKPTSQSYTALIHAYSVDALYEEAYTAYENMKRERIAPSIETYTALLDALRRAGDADKLMEIWKSMLKNKVEVTSITFNTILDGLAKHGLYAQARDVIHEFGKIGLQPTVMTYNILMNAYARGGLHCKLPELLKEMTALNIKPDSVTYATMIYAYVRVRDFTRAFYYHKQMVRNRQVPEARSYQKIRAILDANVATKNWRDRSAIHGIMNSKFGSKQKKGKKDEFWKNRKKRYTMTRDVGEKE